MAGAAAVALAVAACSSATSGSTTSTAAPSSAAAPATAVAGAPIQKTVDAATAFLATLNDDQKKTVSFDWTDTEQKQRWSNFPNVAFQRAG